MARWIIRDQGLNGAWYTCSECNETFWNILNKIDYEKCMNCGAPINWDDNEYYMDPEGDWRR